eukprot:GEMP01024486.1.p1 GENE.GEMP01024486.1~~GEMP01024486.1.p1  ORF type:complete len:762 (+),score=166.21 GEMP01024486.1:25-2310(+)
MERSVRVSCRLRPVLPSEENQPLATWELNEKSITLPTSKRVRIEGKSFDRVEETFMEATYDSTKTNQDVYAGFQHIVHEAIEDGLNGAIMAYGQTGSGKTHSIVGHHKDPDDLEDEDVKGLMGFAVEDVFRLKKENQRVKISYMELYLEKINDLIGKQENLPVKEDVGGINRGFFVDGLLEREVTSYREVMRLVTKAERRRRVSSTRFNEKSSRSHTILTLQIFTAKADTDNPEDELTMTTVSKLLLVDLAGNERLDEQISYINESNSINKSLFFLGEVISRLSQGDDHIPYRNSKLTSILSVHLGQNSNTALLVTLHPLEEFIDESLMTLRFAQKASTIKCEVRPVFESKEHMVILKQRQIIAQLRERIHELESLPLAVERPPSEAYVSSSKELDEIVVTLHQNQQVLEREKAQLMDALRKIGQKMEQVSRKAADALGTSLGDGDSFSRLERGVDHIENEMAKMREMQKRIAEFEKENSADNSTREPTPVPQPSTPVVPDITAEQKAREENTRLRAHAKYLAMERDKWRQECQNRIDENMQLIDQKDEAIRESEKRRRLFEVEMALCKNGLQNRIDELKNEKTQLQQLIGEKPAPVRPTEPAQLRKNSRHDDTKENMLQCHTVSKKDSGTNSTPSSPAHRLVYSPVQSPVHRPVQKADNGTPCGESRAVLEIRPNIASSVPGPLFPGLSPKPSHYAYQNRSQDKAAAHEAPERRKDAREHGKPIKWSAREMFLTSPSLPEPSPVPPSPAFPSPLKVVNSN